MNITTNNEIIDWDVIDVSEFVQIKENYINLDGKTEDNLLSEGDKNIEQTIFTEWKNLTKQNKCVSETNPDNVEELVTYTDSEASYIVEKEEPKNLNDVIITEVDDIIEELEENDTTKLIENDKLDHERTNVIDNTSQIKNVTNHANGDVVITFNENTSKSPIRKRKTRKNKNKLKLKLRKQKGKEIFMMIKIDQWAAVHPESLDSEIEMINVRKLFEFIWAEMHQTEKYAYFKYPLIDEKYKTAKTNNIFKKICNFFDNMMESVGFFMENLMCFHDEDEKRELQSRENFKNRSRNLKD
jgi:hypothetical protein